MDWARVLQGLGILGLIASIRPIWWGFQRPLCPTLSSGGSCTPNPFYLIPGLFAALIGISLVVYAHRRRTQDNPMKPRA